MRDTMHPNEQKQQFSFAYLRAVASVAGYAITRPEVDDDSVDLTFSASGGERIIRSPRLDAQVKCSARQLKQEEDFAFRLPLKNYEDLRSDRVQVPRILIVTIVPTDSQQWVTQTDADMVLRRCAYWVSLRGCPDQPARRQVQVTIPRGQRFSSSALGEIMTRISHGGMP